MKTAAIIAEYNPFHNGHKYQIEETKRLTGADFILVVMSGDFVQRGAPAVFNKYLRTRMALLGGADVVLELPCLYAVSSAEFFAGGGVSLLNRLGVTDYLSFGSEWGDIHAIKNCAEFFISEPSAYRHLLASFLKQGMSFPAARNEAFLQTAGNDSSFGEIPDSLLSSPNNILALEYCKSLTALHSSITPITIKRLGDAYHETSLNEDSSVFSSASAIRRTIEEGSGEFLTCDDFSSLLHYRLLMEYQNGFTKYLDCSSELSRRIVKYLPDFTDFTGFAALLKSKNVTYTKVSRALIHILLDITTPDSYLQPVLNRELSVPYARLLGFKKEATPLLSAIKQNSEIPIISKPADARNILDDAALSMLEQDIFAGNIYESVFSQKYKRKLPVNEYRQSPVII